MNYLSNPSFRIKRYLLLTFIYNPNYSTISYNYTPFSYPNTSISNITSPLSYIHSILLLPPFPLLLLLPLPLPPLLLHSHSSNIPTINQIPSHIPIHHHSPQGTSILSHQEQPSLLPSSLPVAQQWEWAREWAREWEWEWEWEWEC